MANFRRRRHQEGHGAEVLRLDLPSAEDYVAGNFTVSSGRYGVCVENLFPFNGPAILAIKLVKKGEGWCAKLYTERTFCSHKAVRKLVKK